MTVPAALIGLAAVLALAACGSSSSTSSSSSGGGVQRAEALYAKRAAWLAFCLRPSVHYHDRGCACARKVAPQYGLRFRDTLGRRPNVNVVAAVLQCGPRELR